MVLCTVEIVNFNKNEEPVCVIAYEILRQNMYNNERIKEKKAHILFAVHIHTFLFS